jgi:hypothetical protein
MKNIFTIMLFVAALSLAANAQQTTTVTTTVAMPPVTTTVQMPVPVKVPGVATTAKVNAEIIASSSTKVVKGAPFSAEGISESVQVLSDGNRIMRSTTTKMFRDGEGRFRREGGGSLIAPVAATSGGGTIGSGTFTYTSGFGLMEAISIFDPVEGVRFVLNPTDKTARRFDVKNMLTEGAVYVNGQTLSPSVKVTTPLAITDADKKLIESNAVAKANVVVMPNMVTGMMSGGKTESLGTKNIEGVETEGTRTVTTIAAGAIGNERPIEIIYERWYSKELDLIVYSRHYDPRFGEQTYRLVNISRSEPDRSLFSVPNDYKMTIEPPMKFYTTVTPATTVPTPKPQ